MSRRFELGISPLLSRLGYVRPDQDPMPSEDGVRPVYSLGFYGSTQRSPGSRFAFAAAFIPGAALQHATAIFQPPPGGCWIHRLAQTGSGSFATDNETPIPAGFVASPGAVFSTEARWDNREPLAAISTPTLGHSVNLTITGTVSDLSGIPPFWWEGTRMFCQNTAIGAPNDVNILYEVPLVGERLAS